MKALIAIPSRSRAHQIHKIMPLIGWAQGYAEGLKATAGEYKLELNVFVEPHQAKDYKMFGCDSVMKILPVDNLGLGYALHQIGGYAIDNGFDVVLKLDDDVTKFVRRKVDADEVFTDMLSDCLEAFSSCPRLGGIGFPYQQHMFQINRWSGLNQRLQTAYWARPQYLMSYDPAQGVVEPEDFLRNILIRKTGDFTLRYGYAGIACAPVGANPGGWQDFDRKANYERGRQVMQQLMPDIVWKPVSKPWAQEPDFAKSPGLRGRGLALHILPDSLKLPDWDLGYEY